MNFKIIVPLLCLLTSIGSSNAFNNSINPVNYNASNVIGSFHVDNFSKIPYLTETAEFTDWVKKYTDIDSNNFNLELTNPVNTNKSIVGFYDNNNQSLYYSITTANTSNVKISENKYIKNLPQSNTNPNHFKIVNKAGRTAAEIRIVLYRSVAGVPVYVTSSTRYNLANGGVLNYNPSPEMAYVTIGIIVEPKWPGDPLLDIWHYAVPLKT